MITLKSNFKTIFFILGLFFLAITMCVSCGKNNDNPLDEISPDADTSKVDTTRNDAVVLVEKDCDRNKYADTIPNELIIYFNDSAHEETKKEIDDWLRNYVTGINFRECRCDRELIFIEVTRSSPIDPETLRKQANDRLKDEGRCSYNLNLSLDIVSDYSTTFFANQSYPPSETSVNVAVIDGGIDQSVFNGLFRDYSMNFTESSMDNVNSHGAVVSKIIAEGVNLEDIILMDLRVFDENGKGNLFDAICATSYAIKNNADIINMSWGYYADRYDSCFYHYLRRASLNNILVVTSAGNDSLNTDKCLHYPSGFNDGIYTELGNVIGVAALKKNEDVLAPYSNFGMNTIGIASWLGDSAIVHDFEGTSFAAPKVTNYVVNVMLDSPVIDCNALVDCMLKFPVPIEGLKVISGGRLKTEGTCP